jgi:hypothetical protein
MRRGTRIHMGVMQHQILDMDEFAADPERRNRIEEMTALLKSIGDSVSQHTFIKPRQHVLRLA